MASRTSHALFELLNVVYLIAFNLAYLAAASVQGLDAVLCWVGWAALLQVNEPAAGGQRQGRRKTGTLC
jgi:hypothetical protein